MVAQIPFDLPPPDWRLTLAFVVVMFVAGLAACLVPARRALTIQPLDALRYE